MKHSYNESMRYIILYKRNEKYDDVIGCSRSKEIAEYICDNNQRCYYVENIEHIVINTPNIDHIYAEKMPDAVLRKRAALEYYFDAINKGNKMWFVDFVSGEIEEGEVFSVHFKDGSIDSFSVEFKESEDFDEFTGNAVGRYIFISKEAAEAALTNYERTVYG